MRILFIAPIDSIHTVRWISQINDQGWDIHLFSSKEFKKIHPDLRNVTIHLSFHSNLEDYDPSVKICGIPIISKKLEKLGKYFLKSTCPNYRAIQLQKIIRKIKPDIIHSLEFQHSAYLTLEAKNLFRGKFPPWIVTNWGSDIYLFGRLSEHKQKIRNVLAACDYYSCECQRDVKLAKDLGYNGVILPVFPNTGGFDLHKILQLRQGGLVSERRLIMLKGYQGWAYRALVGLRALERSADLLKGYTICIYLAVPDVQIAAELFTHSTGIPVKIIPPSSHEEILKYHGQARISIGINISDSISTSFLEALVMGSFPIQTWTSCANEWIIDGKTGILVPPEDPEVIEMAIRRALVDDNLVNQASIVNWETAIQRLNQPNLKDATLNYYNQVTINVNI